MKFDAKYSGLRYSLINGDIYNWNSYGKMASASVLTNGTVTVTLTGYTTQTPSGTTMYQTTTGGYIDLADGWREVGTGYVPQVSQSEAQKQVNTIIKNNQIILERCLLCSRFANKLTKQQQATLYALMQRLNIRNQRLLEDGLCTQIQTAPSRDFDYFAGDLQNFLYNYDETQGVGGVTIAIVIGAIIIASLSTAVYFAYKYYADQSEKDVKFSRELTEALVAKLTPEEYQQLLNETKGIVTKARIAQAAASTASTFWKTSKFWVFGTLAVIGVSILAKTIREQRR